MIRRFVQARLALAFSITVFARLAPGAEPLTPMVMCSSPALSPDGARLVVEWGGDLWGGSPHGGVMTRLTASPSREGNPRISPDGQRLAFVSDRSGSNQVYVMPVDGGAPRQVTFHSEGSVVQDWSPDGKSLLIAGRRAHFWTQADRLMVVDVDGTGAERLAFDAYATGGRFMGETGEVLFTRLGAPWWRGGYRGAKASQAWRRHADASYEPLIEPAGDETPDIGYSVRSPLWHAPTESVLYLSNRTGVFNVFRRASDGVQQQLTNFADGLVVEPSVSREAGLLVFRRGFELFRLNLDEPADTLEKVSPVCRLDETPEAMVRSVVSECSEVHFTPDGLEIAMIAQGDLWLMDTVLREPQRVTSTPGPEASPCFSPSGDSIAYVGQDGDRTDLWLAKKQEGEEFWWSQQEYQLTRLTDDANSESRLKWSPDGDRLAYVRGPGDLVVMDVKTSDSKVVISSWDAPRFDWSPDGDWLCFSVRDNDYNADVYLAAADGSAEPVNLSRHPDNDSSPVWSPDGLKIAFTGVREGDETDIFVVRLESRPAEQRGRTAELLMAMEKMRENRSGAGGADEETAETPDRMDLSTIDSSVDDRVTRIRNPDVREYSLVWSPDSKEIAFEGTSPGERWTYKVGLERGDQPKVWSEQTGDDAVWLAEPDALAWVSGGAPALLTSKGDHDRFRFKAYHSVTRADRNAAIFDTCWRVVRDTFYDPGFHGTDWNEIRDRLRPVASQAVDHQMLGDVVCMMLGELNASHQRLTLFDEGDDAGWAAKTHHVGCVFRRAPEDPPVVEAVLPNGSDAGIEPGETVTHIDGQPVASIGELDRILTGPPKAFVELSLAGKSGGEKTARVATSSYSDARRMLYDAWVERQRSSVDQLSGGRLGYIHIRSMGNDNLPKFESDLFDAGAGKEGLVVDVRFNGGGRIADHLLTMLAQPVHAVTKPRGGGDGYPQDRRIYATWSKPIIVLCNQPSASNAEIFSHAIQTLGRGDVVGSPTAGYVLTAGSRTIDGFGKMRITQRSWRVATTGLSMESQGVVPDIRVDSAPGELPSGVDKPLVEAVMRLTDVLDQGE